MKSSELLIEAKKFLWNGKYGGSGKTVYLCHAIWHAGNDKGYSYMAEKLKAVVTERIYPFNTLERWLLSKGVDLSDALITELQTHRHAWLDQLIAEYQQKGD